MQQFRVDRKFNAGIVFVLSVVSFCDKRALSPFGTCTKSGTRAKGDNIALNVEYFSICVNLLSIKFSKQCARSENNQLVNDLPS